MPLGLMPDMNYEEKEEVLGSGDTVLFHSDGLVEAHNPQREMFGFPRLKHLVGTHSGGALLIDFLLGQLVDFAGAEWEQEDDVTLVTLQRATVNSSDGLSEDDSWRTLVEFTVPSEPGNERIATSRIAACLEPLEISESRIERLKTAVAEATMNAMEHGNNYQAELPVSIKLSASKTSLSVKITDHGGGEPIAEAETPDIEAKLIGAQSPRGWGLFLIQNMVDEMRVTNEETHHTLELILNLEGEQE